MSRFLKSTHDGSLICKFCKEGEAKCTCILTEGYTKVEIVAIECENLHNLYVHLRRQTLSGGKRIPSGASLWIRRDKVCAVDTVLKYISVDNQVVNSWRF